MRRRWKTATYLFMNECYIDNMPSLYNDKLRNDIVRYTLLTVCKGSTLKQNANESSSGMCLQEGENFQNYLIKV